MTSPAIVDGQLPDRPRATLRSWTIALVIGLLVFAIFWPSVRCGFVDIDDGVYIGPVVRRGLTLEGWHRALQPYGYWSPVTFLSYELDAQLMGPGLFGFHFTNVLLHSVDAALLFVALRWMTGSTWRSAAAVALFALHPLRVESVTWISERKTVLCTFFGLLTLLCYLQFARRRSWSAYGAMVVMYALCLMAKPTLVSLPLLLLMLDYWPLDRLGYTRKSWIRCGLEKLPMLAMAMAQMLGSTLTMNRTMTNANLEMYGVGDRLANCVVSTATYLVKLFDLTHLAYDYPLQPNGWPAWRVAASAIAIIAITALAFLARRRAPWLLAGWLWYVIALLPNSGLVQINENAYADRYCYISCIGLSWMIAFSLPRGRKMFSAAAIAVAIVTCCVFTERQIPFWKDTRSLVEHSVAVTDNNYDAEYILATLYLQAGERERALPLIEHSLSIEPRSADAHLNAGDLQAEAGKWSPAATHYQLAMKLDPDMTLKHGDWLFRQAHLVKPADAVRMLRQCVLIDPENATAWFGMGVTLNQLGQPADALRPLVRALQFDPNSADVLQEIALAELKLGHKDRAIAHLRRAYELAPTPGLAARLKNAESPATQP